MKIKKNSDFKNGFIVGYALASILLGIWILIKVGRCCA